MTVAIRRFPNSRAYKYKYDQLNRITALDSTWAGTALTTLPSAWTKSLNHAERITYDPNGNIKTYKRCQQAGPAKWVAQLRTLKTTDTPLYMYCNMETGHGGASGRFERFKETAMEWAFFVGFGGEDCLNKMA